MGKAVEEVLSKAWHRSCTFHIMQNAIKHLHEPKNVEKDEDTRVLSVFSACMFEYEDIEEFEHNFDIMRKKHFEKVLQGKRNTELKSEFESRKKLPKICTRRPPPMLVEASKLYTPRIFEAFEGEYEISLAACSKALDDNNEYLVGDFTCEDDHKVVGDPLKQMVVCSCGQFDRIGILCGHALKVLDLMNIKSLSPQYVLKRWTREAQSGTIQDNQGRNIIENPKMDAMLRYRFMSQKFLSLAHRAANFPECTTLVDNALDILGKQIEDKINACTSISGDPFVDYADINPPDELLSAARLKKKDVRIRSSKRGRCWLEKKIKARKKRLAKKSQIEKEANSDGAQAEVTDALVEVVEEEGSGGAQAQGTDDASRDKLNESEDYKSINSFTQLLTGPITYDLLTTDNVSW
ncbi:protein FAR1-RELATED SEQUENCE 1-like [Oryza brachyantha]|uniref:protein FAR1-RELATED SEQUENCE 1-like n=1 Tax=Oryza brachyantha TaxID=4533 RepID=UPI001ADD04BB|nr:protein FAR1-RELATED SEQUENCE 1-like [Oryza brachyantha]